MELQLKERTLRCLGHSAADTVNVEQTLELRLPENMPPIGRVLGAWGQPLLRGKDWQGEQALANGGVMVKALYESEDGLGVHCVEGWIPFTLRWELRDSRVDGHLVVSCRLRSVDARQVGAEKLMLRASVSAMAQALEERDYPLWEAEGLGEDVQLKWAEHSLCLAMEAGERPMTLEEELILPPGQMDVSQVLFYQLTPKVTEKKLMGDKLLFRGTAQLHGVYLGVDGMLHAYDTELPISQFGELGREYGPEAELWVEPAVTDLELSRSDDSRLRLKADILGQYVVYDRPTVSVVEDAYVPGRPAELQLQQVMLPSVVQRQGEDLAPETETPMGTVVNTAVYAGQPRLGSEATVEGSRSFLYYDEDNVLQTSGQAFTQQFPLEQGRPMAWLSPADRLHLWYMADTPLTMVSGLTVGEAENSQRPSLILRRPGGLSLWELAKKCGSTVAAIREANGLEGEPQPQQMLILPVK